MKMPIAISKFLIKGDMVDRVAANVQGFLLCWYSVLLQPEPLLSKVNAVDVIFCCSALFVQPGLQMISERDDQYIFFSQHSRKPHVGSSHSPQNDLSLASKIFVVSFCGVITK